MGVRRGEGKGGEGMGLLVKSDERDGDGDGDSNLAMELYIESISFNKLYVRCVVWCGINEFLVLFCMILPLTKQKDAVR